MPNDFIKTMSYVPTCIGFHKSDYIFLPCPHLAVLDEIGGHDDAVTVDLPQHAPHVLYRPLGAAWTHGSETIQFTLGTAWTQATETVQFTLAA